jgi:hypothetical protein
VATAYTLSDEGAFACGYGYGTTDPCVDELGYGSVVPHGSASAGGFGLSVTELGQGDGLIIYWLQKPGGLVFKRTGENYDGQWFSGAPQHFVEAASKALGQQVNILFSEAPMGLPESLQVMHDEQGSPTMVVAKRGGQFSFSVLNPSQPFYSKAAVKLARSEMVGDDLSTPHFQVSMSADKLTATVRVRPEGATEVDLTAADLERAVSVLGEARATMAVAMPSEPPQHPGHRELVVTDPAWRTMPPLHASLDGIFFATPAPLPRLAHVSASLARSASAGQMAKRQFKSKRAYRQGLDARVEDALELLRTFVCSMSYRRLVRQRADRSSERALA